MKAAQKLVCIALLLLLVIGFAAGCAANDETKPLKAVVIQVFPEGGIMLVEIDEDAPRYGGVQVLAPMEDSEEFEVGERISVYIIPDNDNNDVDFVSIARPEM